MGGGTKRSSSSRFVPSSSPGGEDASPTRLFFAVFPFSSFGSSSRDLSGESDICISSENICRGKDSERASSLADPSFPSASSQLLPLDFALDFKPPPSLTPQKMKLSLLPPSLISFLLLSLSIGPETTTARRSSSNLSTFTLRSDPSPPSNFKRQDPYDASFPSLPSTMGMIYPDPSETLYAGELWWSTNA